MSLWNAWDGTEEDEIAIRVLDIKGCARIHFRLQSKVTDTVIGRFLSVESARKIGQSLLTAADKADEYNLR